MENIYTESDRREYYLKTLSENCIYIPFRYVLPLIESGTMETIVNTIEQINKEEEKQTKKWNDENDLLRLYEKHSKSINEKRKEEEEEDSNQSDVDIIGDHHQKKIKTEDDYQSQSSS